MSKSNTMESEQLTDSMYYILLALLQERHGYAIMKFIEELTRGLIVIGPGTLYTLLKKLCKMEWIIQTDTENDRTKSYVITPLGKSMVENEVERRKAMVDHGLKLLEEKKNEESKNEEIGIL